MSGLQKHVAALTAERDMWRDALDTMTAKASMVTDTPPEDLLGDLQLPLPAEQVAPLPQSPTGQNSRNADCLDTMADIMAHAQTSILPRGKAAGKALIAGAAARVRPLVAEATERFSSRPRPAKRRSTPLSAYSDDSEGTSTTMTLPVCASASTEHPCAESVASGDTDMTEGPPARRRLMRSAKRTALATTAAAAAATTTTTHTQAVPMPAVFMDSCTTVPVLGATVPLLGQASPAVPVFSRGLSLLSVDEDASEVVSAEVPPTTIPTTALALARVGSLACEDAGIGFDEDDDDDADSMLLLPDGDVVPVPSSCASAAVPDVLSLLDDADPLLEAPASLPMPPPLPVPLHPANAFGPIPTLLAAVPPLDIPGTDDRCDPLASP